MPSVAKVTCDVHQLSLDGGSGVDYVTVPSMAYQGLPPHPAYPYELAQPPVEPVYPPDQGIF